MADTPSEGPRARVRRHPFHGWNPRQWVGLSPNGLGYVKPNHFAEMLQTAWRNRDQLPFAWRILTQGVCDGCALGTSGLRDHTIPGPHLCTIRLHLLRLNTAPALDPERLRDVAALAGRPGAELRDLGRLPFPMRRRRGEPGFSRVSWEEAIGRVASRIRAAAPERMAFYLTSRGITNEVYYVASKVARFLGTNNVDNSARLCHSPSTVVLKEMLGVGASTCSYVDWIGADWIVFFGSHTPNNQPVTTKYLYHAKQEGTRIAVVNPHREPGLERYWVPSILESALFGTRFADEFFEVDTGGDAAFLSGVLKSLVEEGGVDRDFVAAHSDGFAEAERWIRATPWSELESGSGTSRERMTAFADLLRQARNVVFVWSMGLTQHRHGPENVRALVNLALARGYVGREKTGLMPIRGHSGVQGGAEVGCVPGALSGWVSVGTPEAHAFEETWGFPIPAARGLDASHMLLAAGAGDLDVLYAVGGNFLDTLPQPDTVRAALSRIPLRVHQDIVVSSQMLVDPADEVWLFPSRTRYEQEGGGTETTTERRILFSPEVPGRRIGESLSDWEILMRVAERARPEQRHLVHFDDALAIRREIARLIPPYAGIETLARAGDQIQYGGRLLCRDGVFPTQEGRAHFRVPDLPKTERPTDSYLLSTRRGKQFNTMVHGKRDPLTGAPRDAVLLAREDAARLGLQSGDPVVLVSAFGRYRGRAHPSPMKPGNLQVHFPEGNVLLESGVIDPASGMPEYNVWVRIERTERNGR